MGEKRTTSTEGGGDCPTRAGVVSGQPERLRLIERSQ